MFTLVTATAAAGTSAAGPTASPAGPALLAGLLLVAAAAGWWVVRRLAVRRALRTALSAADPQSRAAAVRQAAELGLGSVAGLLLQRVAVEQDPAVLHTVVDVVAGRQWEPASTGRLVELRLWAKAYVQRQARPDDATDRLTRRSARDDSTDAPAARRASDHWPVLDTGPVADPDPLPPTRVLVTGAGGPAGMAVIADLRAHGHVAIAVDADPLAVGLRLADEGHVIPRCTAPDYLAALLRVARQAGAEALICTVAEEYAVLADARDHLREAGLATLLPSSESVRRCVDKWLFAETMREAALPTPTTGLGSAAGVTGPWIVKPRYGRGSRDVVAASSKSALAVALRTVPDPIVQTRQAGQEFTVDVLADATGALVAIAPRWRLQTRGGISTVGETFADERVSEVAALVVKAVGLTGPGNLQGFRTPDGDVIVHEVNPRFSGGLPLTLAAGADLVEEYLRAVMGRPVRPERCAARPGVRMLRRFAETFEAAGTYADAEGPPCG